MVNLNSSLTLIEYLICGIYSPSTTAFLNRLRIVNVDKFALYLKSRSIRVVTYRCWRHSSCIVSYVLYCAVIGLLPFCFEYMKIKGKVTSTCMLE